MGDQLPTRDDEDAGQFDDSDEEDDDDYVPSGEGSDVSVDEDAEDEGDEDYEAGDGRKKRKAAGKKKRASALRTLAQPEDSDQNEEGKESGGKPEEVDKQRADSLWADFLKDVDPPPKKTTAAPAQTKVAAPSQSHEIPSGSKDTKQATKKVTITKVYDFAGESVTVTKEVDRDSKEAQEFLGQKDLPKEGSGSASEDSSSKEAAQSSSPAAAASGVKRSGGVGSLVGQILKKKQKLNTLEKSKLDWDVFKQKEGIDEELKRHNLGKDGYLERQAFLERTDLRQFELEKTLRMKSRTSNR